MQYDRRSFIKSVGSGCLVLSGAPLLGVSACSNHRGEPDSNAGQGSEAVIPKLSAADRQHLTTVQQLLGDLPGVGYDPRGFAWFELPGNAGPVRVELLARAQAASAPLAQTEFYSLFLANQGTGTTPTDEAVGVKVLEQAQLIRRREQTLPRLALISYAERSKHPELRQGS